MKLDSPINFSNYNSNDFKLFDANIDPQCTFTDINFFNGKFEKIEFLRPLFLNNCKFNSANFREVDFLSQSFLSHSIFDNMILYRKDNPTRLSFVDVSDGQNTSPITSFDIDVDPDRAYEWVKIDDKKYRRFVQSKEWIDEPPEDIKEKLSQSSNQS